jgi:plasmid rolling circle replication initiator protein Rep
MTQKGNGLFPLPDCLPASDKEKAHSEKLRQYASAKVHSTALVKHILKEKPLLFKVAESLQDCGSWLVFRHFFRIGEYRMIGGCTCKKHLLCALCAMRRSAKLAKNMTDKIMFALGKHPQSIPVMISLTVKNGASLEDRYSHLSVNLSRLLHKRRNELSGLKTSTVFSLLQGGAGSFEFKRGSGSNMWHPHCHMIALVDTSTNLQELQENISQEWHEITGDSFVVDVRPVRFDDEETLFKSVCEVCKYALKFNELSFDDQVHAFEVLSGRRLVFSFGCLWGIKLPDDLHDTIEDELALQPYIDLFYQFVGIEYYLSKTGDMGSISAPNKNEAPDTEKMKSRFRKLNTRIPYTKNEMVQWIAQVDLPDRDFTVPF